MSPFTFNYHAGALALGGTRKSSDGVTQIIPSVAAAELSPAGGEGTTLVYNYNQNDISFSHARSTVVGRSDKDYRTFTTTTEVYITDLNIFGRIKAAILHTEVTSTRIVDPNGLPTTQGQPDNSVFQVHAMIRDLVIDGVEVVPQYDFDLVSCGTYESFKQKLLASDKTDLQERAAVTKGYEERFDIPEGQLQAMLVANHGIRGSFYTDASCNVRGNANVARAKRGMKVKVGGFGNVHLGELLVNPGHRRVNLLRLKLDSTVTLEEPETPANARTAAAITGLPGGPNDEGELAFVTVDGNGTPSWP